MNINFFIANTGFLGSDPRTFLESLEPRKEDGLPPVLRGQEGASAITKPKLAPKPPELLGVALHT